MGSQRWVRRLGLVAVGTGLVITSCSSGPGANEPVTKPVIRVVEAPDVGKVLVDSQGRPLYVNNVETARRLVCDRACTSTWRPVTVPTKAVVEKLDGVNGSFGTVKRRDGSYQLMLTGQPLYTYVKDEKLPLVGSGATGADPEAATPSPESGPTPADESEDGEAAPGKPAARKLLAGNWVRDSYHGTRFTWHVATATGARPTPRPTPTPSPTD